MITLNPQNLYSKDKKDLMIKIAKLILSWNDESERGVRIFDALKRWLYWYNTNINEFIIPKLKANQFLRAFYCDPNFFAIQIWEQDELESNIRVQKRTLYANDFNFNNNDNDTVVIYTGKHFESFDENAVAKIADFKH